MGRPLSLSTSDGNALSIGLQDSIWQCLLSESEARATQAIPLQASLAMTTIMGQLVMVLFNTHYTMNITIDLMDRSLYSLVSLLAATARPKLHLEPSGATLATTGNTYHHTTIYPLNRMFHPLASLVVATVAGAGASAIRSVSPNGETLETFPTP